MATYQVNVNSTKDRIPFPKRASIGDFADVFFPIKNGAQLVHRYQLTMKGWQYITFQIFYDK